jgi:hypothetical protein
MMQHTESIPLLFDRLDQLQKTVDGIKKPPYGHNRRIPIIGNELLLTRETFENTLYRQEELNLDQYRGNFEEAVLMYDKLLYQASDKIAGNYMILITMLAKLKVLRTFMLEMLFGKTDVFSFYLYFVDTEHLHLTLTELPIISLDKVFLMSYGDFETDKDENHPDLFVEVCMTRSKLVVKSPKTLIEFNLKYRKTVLRVLYSIYRDKYYMYHLSERDEPDDAS